MPSPRSVCSNTKRESRAAMSPMLDAVSPRGYRFCNHHSSSRSAQPSVERFSMRSSLQTWSASPER